MRFALVNKELVEAKAGLEGICPGCEQPVVAKCGTKRIHHWAHRGNKMCDDWWEPETEWHRAWKNNFPAEWQEIFLPDIKTGEKHIADVRTSDGLVVEFQHSHIDPQERISREKFYKTMVWVVDGTRLKRDFPRFVKGKDINFHSSHKPKIFEVGFVDECFPAAWLESAVPVLFDFLGTELNTDNMEKRPLYCLFPFRLGRYAIVAEIPRKAFIKSVFDGEWLSRTKSFKEEIDQITQARKIEEQRQRGTRPMRFLLRPVRYVRRKRRF